MIRKCKFCKKNFVPNRNRYFLCSDDCKIKYKKVYRKEYYSSTEYKKISIVYRKEQKRKKEQERLEKYGDEVIVPLRGANLGSTNINLK